MSMPIEKITVEQAVIKLSEANTNNAARLNDIEAKLAEMQDNSKDQNKKTTDHPQDELSLQEKIAVQIEAIKAQTQEWQNSTIRKLEQKEHDWEYISSSLRDMKTELQKLFNTIASKPTEETSPTPSSKRNSIIIDESFNNEQVDRQHQATTIVIPPPSSVPTFSGSATENPRQFLVRVKEYTESINHWTDQLLLKGISQFLRDTALEWYCQLSISNRRPQTWMEFKILFLNQFNSPIRRARQEQEWKKCKQEENETINEFIGRLRALWQEQKPNETENDLIRHLMCKMRNDVLSMIGISRCESLDEFIIEAQKVEEILYQRSKQAKRDTYDDTTDGTITTTPIYNDDNHPELQTMSTYRTNQQSRSYNRRNVLENGNRKDQTTARQLHQSSYPTVNQWGTYSSSQVICYGCGGKGHIRKFCPYENKTQKQLNSWHHSKNEYGARGGWA